MNHLKLLPITLSVMMAQAANAQTKIFVKAGAIGTHTGTSWSTAYDDLTVAIAAASAGDSIFIAKGNYFPSVVAGSGSDPRDKTFLIKDQVSLYGGFAGTESKLTDRVVSAIPTNASVLSGNIGLPDSSDNVYHVVTAINISAKTRLDGIYISAGNANGVGTNTISGKSVPRDFGGGIYSDNSTFLLQNSRVDFNCAKSGGGGMNNENGSNLTVNNSIFYDNRINGSDPGNGGGGAMRNNASAVTLNGVEFSNNKAFKTQGGGALRNEASSASFNWVIFSGNHAEDGDGGGAVYNANGSNGYFTNVEFTLNTTENQAGGMYNDNSSPTLSYVSFYRNSGTVGTGAMENDGGSNAILNNVYFGENTTPGNGGAMQNWKSNPILTDVVFASNTAGEDGGGLYNYNNCSPKLTRCYFVSNSSVGDGGGIYNKRNSHPVITNTLLAYNTAGNDGGGIYNVANNSTTGSEPCSPIFTNVSIANNIAGNTGGGGFDDGWGSSKLRNSIVTGNHAANVDDIDAPPTIVATALFRALVGDQYFVTGVSTPIMISGDVFLDTLAGDFRLAESSAAIDKGDSNFYAVGATPDISTAGIIDIRNADRIMGLNIDLGAFEVCTDTLKPAVSIIPATTTTVTVGSVTTFVATVINGGTSPAYSWKKNGTAVGVYTSTYVATAGTDFVSGDLISVDVVGSEDIACMSADTMKSAATKMLIPSGIGFVANNEASIKIYPNPNKGDFTVETKVSKGNEFKLNILDLTGRIIYTDTIIGTTKTLNLAGKIPAGTYMLSIENAEISKQVVRFVIQ